jgi:hypothetical protein
MPTSMATTRGCSPSPPRAASARRPCWRTGSSIAAPAPRAVLTRMSTSVSSVRASSRPPSSSCWHRCSVRWTAAAARPGRSFPTIPPGSVRRGCHCSRSWARAAGRSSSSTGSISWKQDSPTWTGFRGRCRPISSWSSASRPTTPTGRTSAEGWPAAVRSRCSISDPSTTAQRDAGWSPSTSRGISKSWMSGSPRR